MVESLEEENPGYHLLKIPKGEFGEFSKIIEEFHEAQDAFNQECTVMTLVELSDLLGAIEAYASKFNITITDLQRMSQITRRAFESGKRS